MTVVAAVLAGAAAFVVAASGTWVIARGRIGALERELRSARELADLDGLTGLYNRRYFHDVLARELSRAHRYGRRLTLMVFDLDDFKSINDHLGHLAGDRVLAETGNCVRAVVRSTDVPCRIGGDELAIILPEASAEDAELIYQRLQEKLSRADTPVPISVSAGVAEANPGETAEDLFCRTDIALYAAKGRGKGQISHTL